MILKANCKLKGISPYSSSRYHNTPRLKDEQEAAYRERTWREYLHYDINGEIFQPPTGYKNGLTSAAKYLGMKVEGKRGKTFMAYFTSGILCAEPVMLGIKKEEARCERLFLPANCKPKGPCVEKIYPLIPEWDCDVLIHILDPRITEPVFEAHMEVFGKFIGVGRFRPENNGFYGRFEVLNVKYTQG